MMEHVDNIFTVTDDQIIESMKFFAERMKLIIEPTAALGLAGLRNCDLDIEGKKIGVIISGGNVDLERFARLIST